MEKAKPYISREEMLKRSIDTRQAKAHQRRLRVSRLRYKGMGAKEIAAALDVKVRTVYSDFDVINQAWIRWIEELEAEGKSTEARRAYSHLRWMTGYRVPKERKMSSRLYRSYHTIG